MAFARRVQIILRHALPLFIFVLVADAQIYRNECRRDAIMKVTDRDKKLTGVILQVRASALPHCVRGCINESMCSSINYKKFATTTQGNNCELLNTNRTSEGANLIAAPGWLHYEPTVQVCSLVTTPAISQSRTFMGHNNLFDVANVQESPLIDENLKL